VKKICLITTGQPTTNPRLVKEADALVESGYEVKVIAAYWADWARNLDDELLKTRSWSCQYVGGDPHKNPIKYFWTRTRYGVSNRLRQMSPTSAVFDNQVVSRVSPDLCSAALNVPADLYIAHNLGALPAAALAGKTNKTKIGFDAEDFHSGETPSQNGSGPIDSLSRRIEGKYLPLCDYITASSSGIASAYEEAYSLKKASIIWNVFPLSDRPPQRGKHDSNEPIRLYWFSQTIGASRGLEDVIAAMGMLPDQSMELHLRGIWQPGYEARLSAFATKHEVDWNRVKVHTPESADQMVRLAAGYDIGLALEPPVSLNRQLCASNKIFTYLLAGNAILASATSGQKEIVDLIGDAGVSYESGDANGLASLLRRWCEDRTALQHAKDASWDCGTNEFNWDRHKKKFLSVIESTLSS